MLSGAQLDRRGAVVLWLSVSERLPATLCFLADEQQFEQNEEKLEKSVLFLIALLF